MSVVKVEFNNLTYICYFFQELKSNWLWQAILPKEPTVYFLTKIQSIAIGLLSKGEVCVSNQALKTSSLHDIQTRFVHVDWVEGGANRNPIIFRLRIFV